MIYSTSIILDERRPKKNGLFPVKLRVYQTQLRKAKLYSTQFEFSKKDFESIWLTTKPRNEHKEIRNKLIAIDTKAVEVCKKIEPFNFVQFEKRYLQKVGDDTNVIYHYKEAIRTLKANDSHSTASTYELSLKSFIAFFAYTKGKEPVKISFFDITPQWLQKYENYMIKHLERSRTTVSMYVRTLRTIFNNAIRNKDIDADLYPFGKNKFQPPAVMNVKKALSKEDLKKLFDAVPQTPEQQKAKDFFFFSYACNGWNIKDIVLLKYEDLEADTIVFYRAKTINTSKTKLKPIIIYLNDFSKDVLKKYGNPNTSKSNYVFSIISATDTTEKQYRKIKNFTKFINHNVKKLALKNEITSDISSYWARHSFGSNSIRNGASMEFVSEAFGHSNIKTTQGYFAGFEDEVKKEFSQKIMNF